MGRIGIITTHRANNFGAVLQAYSLAKACLELGFEAEILDWRCRFYDWQYHEAIRITRNPFVIARHYFWHAFKEAKSRKLFNEFRARLPLSRPIRSRNELVEISRSYDKFIVGSDQVWNPLNSALRPENFDRTFVLDFAREKSKNAYAASIGVSAIEPENVRNEFVNAWKSFDVITMREYEGAKYVSNFLGKPIDTVLDPVLLHDRNWWKQLVVQMGSNDTPHVLLYNVRAVPALDMFALKIAKIHGAKLIKPLIPSFSSGWNKLYYNLGPVEFVSELSQANSVVTSSFHAAAFSVIFGKRLYLIRRKRSNDPNSRFSSLIRFAGLEGEIVDETDSYFISEIDCSKADQESLSKARTTSLSILRQICMG